MEDIYDSKPYRTIRGFYDRLPIKASTKQGLDDLADDFVKVAAADSAEERQNAVEDMQDKQKELVDNDQVYKQAVEYIKVMSPDNADETSASAVAVRGAESFGNMSGDGVLGQRILPQSSTARPEDSINQVGDMLFRNAAASSSGSVIGFSPLYAKEWSHVGTYAGPGNIYDSNNQDCEGTDSDGVAVRLLQEFYDDADTIMYAQLANSSWRSNQAEVLKDAKSNYGTNCSTPFNMNPFSMNGTSSFFCSKLVWRAYLDDDNYPVDLDSNSWTYYWWLLPRYGWATSWYIITHTVAPDEIALSSHVDRYYQKELSLPIPVTSGPRVRECPSSPFLMLIHSVSIVP